MSRKKETISLVANTIKDEVSRMCVTEDLAVIDALYVHAHNNLENLYKLVQEVNSKELCCL